MAGGGAIEMELSRFLRNYARTIQGKEQLIINAYAKAMEVIPRTIAENAGLDSIDVMNKLRQKHAQGNEGKFFGVDVNSNSGFGNNYVNFVWEPIQVRQNAFIAATEAACTILSIDETVRNPKSEEQQRKKPMGKMAPQMPGLNKNMRLK